MYDFQIINIEKLKANISTYKVEWNSKKPFRYFSVDEFLVPDWAEKILSNYPKPDVNWESTTYINQKNKFQKTKFEAGSIFNKVFEEMNHPEFLSLLSEMTGIENLIPDNELFGGGLHQSIKGAFLDVHIDYNFHPETKLHRRLNILVYMNKDWEDQFEGHLELWDMDKKELLEKIAPLFNRMAMFETNELSWHGHPHKLNTPDGVSRKSMAAYYYTKERDDVKDVSEHNTKYINTTGATGKMKNLKSGVKALFERIKSK